MKKTLIAIFILFSLILTSCSTEYSDGNGNNGNVKSESQKIKITGKEVKRINDSDKYLIFSNNGTYEITDTLLNGRFNSADLYGRLEEGKCYEIYLDAMSFRSGFLSSYENIVTANEYICEDLVQKQQENEQNLSTLTGSENVSEIDCPLFGKTTNETCDKFSKCLDGDEKRLTLCKEILK